MIDVSNCQMLDVQSEYPIVRCVKCQCQMLDVGSGYLNVGCYLLTKSCLCE